MKKLTAHEKQVKDYYEHFWPKSKQRSPTDEIYGFHYGFFEKGIRTTKEANLNMNSYIGRRLELDNKEPLRILDVGCGIGSTLIYLAKKYPNNRYSGIAISPTEIKLSSQFAKERNLNNTKFILANYIDTGFPNGYFDRIFALESMSYAQNKEDFLQEMYRILKPNGKRYYRQFSNGRTS